MGTLEIALIIIVWVMYGILSAIQDKSAKFSDSDGEFWKFVCHIIFSPIIFVGKAIYGVFKSYCKED